MTASTIAASVLATLRANGLVVVPLNYATASVVVDSEIFARDVGANAAMALDGEPSAESCGGLTGVEPDREWRPADEVQP